MTSRSLEDLSATNTNATLLHSEEQHQHHQPIDLTGSYKLVQSDNVDAFLAAQGVPWALRRLAVTATPLHHLIHSASTLTIKIEAPGFVSQTVYPINGPVVETNIRGRIFRDVVRYYYADNTNATTPDATAALNNNNNGEHNNNNATINTTTMVSSPSNNNNKVEGIVTEKRAVAEGYVVTVIRRLSDCKSRIDLKCTVTFPNEPHKESIVSTQVFERIVSQ